jgi:DNA repair photolyase
VGRAAAEDELLQTVFRIFAEPASTILTRTCGFIAEAGFSHSLTPALNCTFGCTYCYVPTMRVYAGLRPADWARWGHFTTFKENAAELLRRSVRGSESIYCSPLVDPYQPAEERQRLMPEILDALAAHPPRVFTIQTRGPLILRDIARLVRLAARTDLRVSFSLTTNRDEIRRWYEPHCARFDDRLAVIRTLRSAGIRTFATLAPILPCDPEEFAGAAAEATTENLVGDPFHNRKVKPRGATTREQAGRISRVRGFAQWHEPDFQAGIVARIQAVARAHGRDFATGPAGFRWLAAQADNR